MLIKQILLFTSFLSFVSSEIWAVKLYPNAEAGSVSSSDRKAQSLLQAKEKYPNVVRLRRTGFPGHIGSGVISVRDEGGIPFVLTNRHVADNAKKMRVRSPLIPKNKATKGIFQLLEVEYPSETDDPTEVINDLAIGFFKYPDLVRAKLEELSITPASLTHLETMLPPREAFEEPTLAEVVGCGKGWFKAKPTLATTHIAHSKGTRIEELAALTDALADANAKLIASTRLLHFLEREQAAVNEALVKLGAVKEEDLDLQVKVLEVDEGGADAQDNDRARARSKEEEEIIGFEEEEMAYSQLLAEDLSLANYLNEAAIPSGPLWGHSEGGESGGGVFVEGKLIALICEGGDRPTINGHKIEGDAYVYLPLHAPWINAQIAASRDGVVRHTEQEIRQILESDNIPAALSDDYVEAKSCCTVS